MNESQEGAAMLIVMLIILMATAVAMFAIHATSYEVRASGHVRQLMQTQYVAEAGTMATLSWVDRAGPRTLMSLMRQATLQRQARGPDGLKMVEFGEPPLLPAKDAYRFDAPQLMTITNVLPVDRESLGGMRQAYAPLVLVDVYDNHIFTRVMAGERADGHGQMRYLRATYTARGRTRLSTNAPLITDFGAQGEDFRAPLDGVRDFHEGASDARAHGVSGPFGGGL
jgi:hypothetical protein